MRLSEGRGKKKKRCRGTGAAAAARWGMKKNQSSFFPLGRRVDKLGLWRCEMHAGNVSEGVSHKPRV